MPAGATLPSSGPSWSSATRRPAKVRRAGEGRCGGPSTCCARTSSPRTRPKLLDVWVFKDRRELREQRPRAVRQHARHAVRLLPRGAPGAGDEHRHRRRDAGARAGAPVHATRTCPTPRRGSTRGWPRCTSSPAERDGHMVGLHELAAAGAAGGDPRRARCRRFATSDRHWTPRRSTSDDDGTHYAQARYLCQYLQEKGQLVDLVRRLRERGSGRPLGLPGAAGGAGGEGHGGLPATVGAVGFASSVQP